MLKTRLKRRAADDARALKRLAEVEASIAALDHNNLLDLADIFKDSVRPL